MSLGDEFNNSYRDVDAALTDMNNAQKLSREFNESYIVIGNHELTYYKNNPLWHLIKSVDSEFIHKNRKSGWKAKGVIPHIKVVDRIVDGDVEFLFNHYGSGVRAADSYKKSIGLFHQDIVFRALLDEAKTKFKDYFELDKSVMEDKHGYVYLDDNNILKGYNNCYYGHSHMLYGTWEDELGIQHNYQASLGRTKESEVRDDFLERNIGVIIVENGKLVSCEKEYFNLMSREECINESSVLDRKEKYRIEKERKSFKNYISSDDDPIANIKQSIKTSPIMTKIVEDILETKPDEFIHLLEGYLK